MKSVEITDVAAEGKSIAKVALSNDSDERIVVFIPYGAPGDVVDIQLDKKKRNYAEGHIETMIKPSENRVTPPCRHFGVCGGCKWQHLPYSLQLECKAHQVDDSLRRIAKVDYPALHPIIGSEKIYGYRNKMEYTFSDRKWRTWEEIKTGKDFTGENDALGFHISGAFDKVLHIEECLLQDDLGNRIRNFIYEYARKEGLSFYNIKENKGLLRTLMIRISSTGETMVVLVAGEDDKASIEKLLRELSGMFPEINSLLYVINLKLNDSIGDQEVILFQGREYIEEEMEGLRFRVNPKSFYQTNSLQAYNLYKVARRFAGLETSNDKGEKPIVYDLYTGTGTIAQFVAKNASKVIGIEYVEEAIADAKLNASINGIDNIDFFAGDMKDVLTDKFVEEHGRPNIIIIDPPRAGMHPDVVEVVKRAAPEVIVYVSCNPATQARDVALLDSDYRITDVQPVDMFPHTHHVENVIRLERR